MSADRHKAMGRPKHFTQTSPCSGRRTTYAHIIDRPRLALPEGGGGAEWQPELLCLTQPPTHIRKFFLKKRIFPIEKFP